MSKKIVVITGSPRKNGNSAAMVEKFIEASEAKGNSVTRFNAAFLNLGGCKGCNKCFSAGKACLFNDDFNKMAPEIEQADAVVFAMPVYWYTIPSQIKAAIDKLYSFVVGGKNIAGKKCALISCCEENDLSVFEGVSIPYKKTASALQWKSVGEVLIPGVLDPGAVAKTDGLAQAAALAEKF